jgi:steroid 5-alpha reductase family enzyme
MKILSLILIMLMILFFVLGDVEMNIRQEDPSYKKALMVSHLMMKKFLWKDLQV